MANTPPSPVPAWWSKPRFSLSEIARFLNVPIATIHLWLKLARATGFTVGDESLHRPLYQPQQVFALAMLAKLHAIRIRVNANIIADAFAFATTPEGNPRPIANDEIWSVIDEDGAILHVQAWLCRTAVNHLYHKPRVA
jgi:hypothetical protein